MIAALATLGAATAAVSAALAMTPTDAPQPVTPNGPSSSPTPTDPSPTGDPYFTKIRVSVEDVEVGDQPDVRVQVFTGPSGGLVLADVARKGGGYHVQRFKEFKDEPDGEYDVRFVLRRVGEPGRYRVHAMFRGGGDVSRDADRTVWFRVRR